MPGGETPCKTADGAVPDLGLSCSKVAQLIVKARGHSSREQSPTAHRPPARRIDTPRSGNLIALRRDSSILDIDQRIGYRRSPAYMFVSAEVLDVANLVALCQQNIPQVPVCRQHARIAVGNRRDF